MNQSDILDPQRMNQSDILAPQRMNQSDIVAPQQMNYSVRYRGSTANESLSPISWLHNKWITQSDIVAPQQMNHSVRYLGSTTNIIQSGIVAPQRFLCAHTLSKETERAGKKKKKKKIILTSWLYMEWRFNIKLCLLLNLKSTRSAAVWALQLDIDTQFLKWPFSSLPHTHTHTHTHTHIQYLCKWQSSSATTTYNFDLQFDNCKSVPIVFKLCSVDSFWSVSHLQVWRKHSTLVIKSINNFFL